MRSEQIKNGPKPDDDRERQIEEPKRNWPKAVVYGSLAVACWLGARTIGKLLKQSSE